MPFDPDKYLSEKSSTSAFDPDKYLSEKAQAAPTQTEAPPQKQSLLGKIGQSIGNVGSQYLLPSLEFAGRQIDRVTTAPLRAGLSSAMDVATENPERSTLAQLPMGLGKFALGAAKQFGQDPNSTPSARSLMERAGVPSTALSDMAPSFYNQTGEGMRLQKGGLLDPTLSGTIGAGLEAAVPIPGLGAARTIGKIGGTAASVTGKAAKGVAKGIDIATNSKVAGNVINAAETIGKGTAGAFEGASKGLAGVFKAKQADDFGESVKTAMANGIDPKLLPEAVEFGPHSIVTRTARVQAEGISGQPLLEKFHEGLNQVRDAVHADIEKIGGGAPLSKPEAGNVLREGFNAGVDRAFEGINTSHKEIIQQAPSLRLSPDQITKLVPKLDELQTWAKAKAENGLTRTAKEQGQQILNAVESFRKKGESYAGAYEALQEIGDVAFKSKNNLADIPPDIQRFRKLYGDISDAMIGTVDDAFGADKAKALRESNAAMHKIYGDKSLLGKIGHEATSPEALFQSIIEHGDTKRLEALKPYLEPEQLASLKGTFLNELLRTDAEGHFPFKSLHNALRQKKSVASALFEPGELDNLQSLIKLGDKFGHAVMSTSGTGASMDIKEGVKAIATAAADNSLSEGLKGHARAIGFDVNAPSKAAAQGGKMPPISGLSLRGIGPKFQGIDIPDWRKKIIRGYSASTNGEQE